MFWVQAISSPIRREVYRIWHQLCLYNYQTRGMAKTFVLSQQLTSLRVLSCNMLSKTDQQVPHSSRRENCHVTMLNDVGCLKPDIWRPLLFNSFWQIPVFLLAGIPPPSPNYLVTSLIHFSEMIKNPAMDLYTCCKVINYILQFYIIEATENSKQQSWITISSKNAYD